MKRIGNFLFVEQWFVDHKPEQAIVNICSIDKICSNKLDDDEQHTVIETQTSRVALTGNHNDNIIELSKLLEKPTTLNQTEDNL